MSRFDFSEIVVEYTQVFQGFHSRVPLGDGTVARTRKGDGKYESHEPFSWGALRSALVKDSFEMNQRVYPNGKGTATRLVREIWRRSLMGTVVNPNAHLNVRVYGA